MSNRLITLVLKSSIGHESTRRDRQQKHPLRRLVALVLANYADDQGGRLFPSMATIALMACVSESQARRIVRGFEKQQLIAVVGNAAGGPQGRSRQYQWNVPLLESLAAHQCNPCTSATPAPVQPLHQRGPRTGAAVGAHPRANGGSTGARQSIKEPSINQNHRFPGDGNITTPAPPEKAVIAESQGNPDASARILAECERAKVTEWNLDIANRWLRMGATPTQVATACAEARKSLHFPKPLAMGYVDKVLEGILATEMVSQERARARDLATREIIEESRAANAKKTPMPAALKKRFQRPSSSEPQASDVLTPEVLAWARRKKISDLTPYVEPFLEEERARKRPFADRNRGFMDFVTFGGYGRHPGLRSLLALQQEAAARQREEHNNTLMRMAATH